MHLQDLKRRYWVIISIAVGLLVGSVRAYFAAWAEPEGPYESVKSIVFEQWMLQRDVSTNQFPGLTNVHVQPYKGREVVVGSRLYPAPTGSGPAQPKGAKGAKAPVAPTFRARRLMMIPDTAVYAAGSPQFNSLTNKEIEVKITLTSNAPGDIDGALEKQGFRPSSPGATGSVRLGKLLPRRAEKVVSLKGVKSVEPMDKADTLVGFFKKVQTARPELKLQFDYAWWQVPEIQLPLWTGVSVVIIGVIWPFMVNLLAFGKLLRPPEEKATIDLSKVKSGTSQGHKAAEVDMAAVQAHADRLEEELAATASAGTAKGAVATAEAKVRQLETAALEAAAEEEKKAKHFAGQFYPTEAHAKQDEN